MRRAALALLPVILLLSCEHSLGQGKVAVHVSANVKLGAWQPIWRYFGYDEPNYTYMNYGKRLLAELSALTPEPVYIRTHNLLTTGNGAPALKWGSTNAYT
ncbi:MAG: GH39 family glycosyl hydrolase, partial [Polyangiales bacterium]